MLLKLCKLLVFCVTAYVITDNDGFMVCFFVHNDCGETIFCKNYGLFVTTFKVSYVN